MTAQRSLLPREDGSAVVVRAGELKDGVIGMLKPLDEMRDRTCLRTRVALFQLRGVLE